MDVRGEERITSEDRLSTGDPELDQILMGGLMPHRPYLVVGPSGTGKTTLALQFLCEGVRRGERCLVVTLEEPPNEMRANHPGLAPELDQVYVFDAIPDVMRYERTPFKDIAAVRESVPFAQVGPAIRKTPELSSVEVTFTALEQTLKMEIARRSYSRLVIDSLTALQYFCMKGVDESVGAQTFLRFLSDLRVTTVLTVEAPLEDVETPERLLARGEIRLFRWELEGRTVRAIGVEKFRGSQHDVRLHPYRISPRGLKINLEQTISRDTRRLVETTSPFTGIPGEEPSPAETVAPLLENLDDLDSDVRDLLTVGVDIEGVREALAEAANVAVIRGRDEALREYQRCRATVQASVEEFRQHFASAPPSEPPAVADAARRLISRAAEARTGVPPILSTHLQTIASRLTALRDSIPVPEEREVRTPPAAVSGATPALTTPVVTPEPPAAVPAEAARPPSVIPSEAPTLPTTLSDPTPPALPARADAPSMGEPASAASGRLHPTRSPRATTPPRPVRHETPPAPGRPSLPEVHPPPATPAVSKAPMLAPEPRAAPPAEVAPIASKRKRRTSAAPAVRKKSVAPPATVVPSAAHPLTTTAPPPPAPPPSAVPPPEAALAPSPPASPLPPPSAAPEPSHAPAGEKPKRRAPRKRKSTAPENDDTSGTSGPAGDPPSGKHAGESAAAEAPPRSSEDGGA